MLSNRIKDATREIHQELESTVVRKLKSIASHKDYAQLLGKFYGFHHPIEKKLDQFLDHTLVPRYTERRRSTLILKDLAAIGQNGFVIDTATTLPRIDSQASALGVFYVLEGSTQGGTMIANLLSRHAGIPNAALHFFNAYDEEEKQMWGSFKEKLDAYPVGVDASYEMIKSAKQTFECFHSWMHE